MRGNANWKTARQSADDRYGGTAGAGEDAAAPAGIPKICRCLSTKTFMRGGLQHLNLTSLSLSARVAEQIDGLH
jgi:hypothetical protein